MARGRLGTSASDLRRASGRAAQKPGSSDPVLSAVRGRGQVDAEELADEELTAGASGRAARRPGSSDPVPSAARARMSRRGRLGRRGAAGRRRTGPAEIKASSDGRGALTHGMMAAVQGYIQWTSREPAGGVMNRLRCGRSSDSVGPGRRRRLAADRAEPAHDPRCTVGGWSRFSANRQR